MHQNVKEIGVDIYRDGTYVRNNPTLHSEDSAYKFGYIEQLLKRCSLSGEKIRILDIGGGAGIIAKLVCQHLAQQGGEVECHVFDPSPEMLAQQQINNPNITLATSDFAKIREQRYDLALLIDVIEHIPDNGSVAEDVDRIARHVIYNIPTERNLFDWLRNLYMRGRYFALQTESLGHVHFYSCSEARQFVSAHHQMIDWVFPDYPSHLLESDCPDYVAQRKNRLRAVELSISRLIYRFMKPLAPWLIQGSLFILADTKALSR